MQLAIDITDEVEFGALNELTHRGLFDGKDYVPEKGPEYDPNESYDASTRIRNSLSVFCRGGRRGGARSAPAAAGSRHDLPAGLAKRAQLVNVVASRLLRSVSWISR